MAKIKSKIAIPIILVGIFAISIFIALEYEKLDVNFYIVLFLLAFFVFVFGFATGQTFTSPVKELLNRATELSKGNLSARAYLETKDEFSELASVLNKIAEELEESHLREENSEKSINLKVKARTQDLEETIKALDQKIKNRTIELEKLIKKSDELQANAKEKEVEISQLKKELNDLGQKTAKLNKPKQEVIDNIENNT